MTTHECALCQAQYAIEKAYDDLEVVMNRIETSPTAARDMLEIVRRDLWRLNTAVISSELDEMLDSKES